MTSVHLPGMRNGAGYAVYGRSSAEEMIATIRTHAQSQFDEAKEILAASDEEFRVETYLGSWVQRNKEVIQEGRPKPNQISNINERGRE